MQIILMVDATRKIIDFLLEIEKLKAVKRSVYTSDGRRETTPEHVWHMCMYAMLLPEKNIGMLRLLKLILIHDLVEVYAGDASVWNEKAREKKKEREQEAAERLFSMLPPPHSKEFMLLWMEFEDGKTSEAKTAKTIDGLQATGQQTISGGRAWKKEGVTHEMHQEKSKLYRKDASLEGVWEEFYMRAVKDGMFADDNGG